jgi:hypothetical protein
MRPRLVMFLLSGRFVMDPQPKQDDKHDALDLDALRFEELGQTPTATPPEAVPTPPDVALSPPRRRSGAPRERELHRGRLSEPPSDL